MSSFQPAQRKLTIDKIIDKYNEIVDECETDPSLRIAVA